MEKILFLCTGNSCRSQMAEAWTWELKGDRLEPYSAGIDLRDLDPRAVKVMVEVGIDIARQIGEAAARSEVARPVRCLEMTLFCHE